jgi:AraC-like DNA-binding protein
MQQAHTDYNIFGISHQKGLQNGLKFHTHFQYEIFIFYNGDVKYAIGNNMYELEAGDIIIMDGSLMHRPFIFSDERFYNRSIVQFSREWIYPVLKALKADNLLEMFEENHFAILKSKDLSTLDELEENVQKIEEYIRDSNANKVDTELKLELTHLLLKLNKLFRKVDPKNSDNLGEKYVFIQEAVQYVQKNYQESFNLDDVADDLNISKSYLVHLFKDLTGSTLMDYAMNYRLKQAMHMLAAYPEMKNKEICYNCGFKNESHFSRYFKKNTGLTPGQFRKRHDSL